MERRQLARRTSGGLSIPVPDPQALGVTDPDDAAWVVSRCTPHPLSTYEDRLQLKGPVGNGLPATYIAVKPDYAPFARSRDFARRQPGWEFREITAGHDAMITSPETLTDVLLEIQRREI